MSHARRNTQRPGALKARTKNSPSHGRCALATGSAFAFIALLTQVAEIEHMIVEGLTDAMPCKKKHIYREQAFRQAISLATTHFKSNNVSQPTPAGRGYNQGENRNAERR